MTSPSDIAGHPTEEALERAAARQEAEVLADLECDDLRIRRAFHMADPREELDEEAAYYERIGEYEPSRLRHG